MTHLNDEQMSAMLDGALPGTEREGVQAHLLDCGDCRARFAALASMEKSLTTVLAHDPGEAYFERFADRVNERITADATAAPAAVAPRGAGASEAKPEDAVSTMADPEPDVATPSRRRPVARGLAGFLDLLRTPRGLAWAGGAAAVIVGGGVVLITARETPIASLRRPALEERANQVAEPPALPRTEADVLAPTDEVADALETPPAEDATGEIDANAKEMKQELRSQSIPAPPARASEARRDLHGEEIPVQPKPTGFATAPPAGGKDAESAAPGTRIPKPTAAPLKAAPKKRDANVPRGLDVLSKTKANESEAKSLAAGTSDAAAPAPAPSTVSGQRESLSSTDARGGRVGQTPIRLNAATPVCGDVRDASGRPIVGAQVAIADLGRSTATDERGHFCIAAPPGQHELSVLAVGFEPQRRPIDVGAGSGAEVFALKAVPVVGNLALNEKMLRGGDRSDWPEALLPSVLRARQHSDRAAGLRSASQFDGAAQDWERVMARAGDSPAALEARYRAAQARYLAWGLEATPERERAALESLTSFLARAPQGAARDSAARWVDRVKR